MQFDKDMEITRIGVRVFSYTSQIRRAFGHSHPGPANTARQTLLEIETRGGAKGYAFGMQPELVDRVLVPMLIGENALYREKIWQKLSELQRGNGATLSDAMMALVDVALWDLAGRAVGLPVQQLLGAFRDKIPAYASTMVGDADLKGGLTSPEAYADFAIQCKEEGYTAYKMHPWMPPVPGAPSVDRDLAMATAVRKAVGPEMHLMFDPYHQYSRQEAKRLGRGLEELGFLWMEEPMREASISSYRWLCDELDLPICGPETAPGQIWTRAEWVLAGACDILRTGVLDVGGITPMMKTIHLAEAHGMSIELHQNGAATLHALGAMQIPGRFYERGLLHPLIKYESKTPWLATIDDPMDAEGFVHVPKGPGMGWDIDWDFIAGNEIK
jgi:L-alanine-DL-glutamate epimerase-like enolase superfamily enzyme|uniref:Mandelate racemase/muconate lactonizing enzyme-like protein n=2 Tax=Phyllobacteriaceae TaxID=69277 RepID=Q11GX6_CHESB